MLKFQGEAKKAQVDNAITKALDAQVSYPFSLSLSLHALMHRVETKPVPSQEHGRTMHSAVDQTIQKCANPAFCALL